MSLKLLADTNIVAQAVAMLRRAGHDVVYSGERDADPGDTALLAEAHAGGRIFITKDHDIGALVNRDGHAHAGVLLLDDLGDPSAETQIIMTVLVDHGERLAAGGFFRVGAAGVRRNTLDGTL